MRFQCDVIAIPGLKRIVTCNNQLFSGYYDVTNEQVISVLLSGSQELTEANHKY